MISSKPFIFFFLFTSLVSCIGEDYIEVDPSQTPRVVIFGTSSAIDSLLVGDSRSYSAAYFNEYGLKTSDAVSWSSTEPTVMSIDPSAKVSALRRGIGQIRATSNGFSSFHTIVVYSIERVEINASKTFLFLNDSLQINARYFDANNQIQTVPFNWSSDNANVVTVNSDGLIVAIAAGQANITATANGIQSDPILFNVINDSNAVASVEIILDTNRLNVGQSFQFLAEVKNGKGNALQLPVNWSSSDSSVVSVNSTGIVRAMSPGVSQIVASSGGVSSLAKQVVVTQVVTGFRQGSFQNENGYSVSGMVEIRPSATNNYELSFTNFTSQAGPALYINMSNSRNSAGIELDVLRQLNGDFTVQLPANIQLDDYDYVLIWCKSANAAFGSALLN